MTYPMIDDIFQGRDVRLRHRAVGILRQKRGDEMGEVQWIAGNGMIE